MNTKNIDTVDLAILAVMALGWAIGQVVRLLVPVVALVVVVLTPRRRPAPEPAPVAAQPMLPPVSLATIAEGLLELPAAELRQITGCRRKVAKQRMVDTWLAMPV